MVQMHLVMIIVINSICASKGGSIEWLTMCAQSAKHVEYNSQSHYYDTYLSLVFVRALLHMDVSLSTLEVARGFNRDYGFRLHA